MKRLLILTTVVLGAFLFVVAATAKPGPGKKPKPTHGKLTFVVNTTDNGSCGGPWANDTVKKGGKSSAMRSFKDPSLSNAVFFLDLLNGVRPGIVDYSLVNNGSSEEDKRMNGMYQTP